MEEQMQHQSTKVIEKHPGEESGDFLKIVAWLYFIASIIGGISFLIHKDGASRYTVKSDPVFVFYGIGLIVSGVVFLAICQVLVAISHNLRTIARNSTKDV